MQNLNLVLFKITEKCNFRNELISQTGKSTSSYDLSNYQFLRDVKINLSKQGHGIIIFQLRSKSDLKEVVSLLRSVRGLYKKKLLKTICILSKRNKKVEDVLMRYGCNDIIEQSSSYKTVAHKIDFLSRPIIKELEQKDKSKNYKSNSQKNSQDKTKAKQKEAFIQVAPLEIESDCWVISSSADYKRILKTYLVRVMGPSPHIGRWVELESKSNKKDELSTWKFVLDDTEDKSFIRNTGSWFFYGSKPDFDWKVQRWRFSSERPHLYFVDDQGTVFSKMEFKSDQVELANNSKYALSLKDKILETCKSDSSFSRDKLGKEDSSKISKKEDLQGKLKGRGKTEHLDKDKLSGKSSTDDLSSDPLAGDVNSEAQGHDPLDGELGTDKLKKDPLTNKRNKTEHINSGLAEREAKGESQADDLLDGKLGTDKLKKDPLSNKKNKTDDLSSDPLAGDVNSETKGKNPIEGELGTDKLKKDPLSNKKNKTDDLSSDPLAGNLKKNKEGEEEALEGELGTDKLKRDPLSNKKGMQKEDSSDPLRGRNEANKEKDAAKARAETEHINRDPLSNKKEHNQNDSSEPLDGSIKNKSEEKDPLAGKSGTDTLERDPLSNKKSSPNPSESSPLDGKTESELGEKDPLSAKAETENLAHDPLSNQSDGPDDVSLDPLAGKAGHEKAKDPLAGKGAIDILTRDPLSNKPQNRGNENESALSDQSKEKDPLSGKAEIDKLSHGPLTGKQDNLNEVAPSEPEYEEDHQEEQTAGALSGHSEEEQKAASTTDSQINGAGISETPRLPTINVSEAKEDSLSDEKDKTQWENPIDKKIDDENKDLEENSGEDLDEVFSDASEPKAVEFNEGDVIKKSHLNESEELSEEALGLVIERSELEDSKLNEDFSEISDRIKKVAELENAELESSDSDENLRALSLVDETQKSSSTNDEASSVGAEKARDINLESGKVTANLTQVGKNNEEVVSICEFVEIYENELTLIAPLSVIFLDENISASITMEYSGEKVEVLCKGKILEHEEAEEEKALVVIDITNVNKQTYDEFLTLFEQRQLSINDFVQRAKGY